MRVFFLSDQPCTLTANGLYLGCVDGHERVAELEPSDGVLLEFKCAGFLPVLFLFNEEFLYAPPEQARLYHTKNGLALYVTGFIRQPSPLRPVWQKQLNNAKLTLYVQGGVQLSIENESGFHVVDLPDAFEFSTVAAAGELFLLERQNEFMLINREGGIAVRSEGKIVERGNTVTAEVPFHDSLRHSALCVWERGKLTDCRIRTGVKPSAATYALALFESALLGADCTPYLADNLAEKAPALKEYLGDFQSVVLTDNTDEVGLVYEERTRVYRVRYYHVAIEGGKVTNITPVENM